MQTMLSRACGLGARARRASSTAFAPLPPVASRLVRGEYAALDPEMPLFLDRLTERKADECWHKHSTFKEHLTGVWKTLNLWGADRALQRCGLYHSAYSNSYVNLALFDVEGDPGDRPMVRADIGQDAEHLVHLFCVVPRHELMTQVLQEFLPPNGQGVPAEGVTTTHIRTGDEIHLTPRLINELLTFTIADIADQYFGWFDELAADEYWSFNTPAHRPWALWPGLGKPGLWMAFASRLARIAGTCQGDGCTPPPVFANSTVLLSEDDERAARDLYWEVVTVGAEKLGTPEQRAAAVATLTRCSDLNPFIAEPHVMKAQLLMADGDFEAADAAAAAGFDLLLEWGGAWDKRVSWEAWLAWVRVIRQRAAEREPWPENALGVINLGLVK